MPYCYSRHLPQRILCSKKYFGLLYAFTTLSYAGKGWKWIAMSNGGWRAGEITCTFAICCYIDGKDPHQAQPSCDGKHHRGERETFHPTWLCWKAIVVQTSFRRALAWTPYRVFPLRPPQGPRVPASMHPITTNRVLVACVLSLPLIPSFVTVVCFPPPALLCAMYVFVCECVC